MERPDGDLMLNDDDINGESAVKKFFRRYYAPLLARWWMKTIVISAFAGLAAVSLYGVTQLQYGQPLSELAPDGSYLTDYDAVQQATYRQQVGEPVGLYFKAAPGQLDASEPATQASMLAAWDIALQSSYVNASTTAFLGNWLVSFLKWAQDRNQTVAGPMGAPVCTNPLVGKVAGNLASVISPTVLSGGCVPADRFYPLLGQWLADNGPDNDIVRDAASGRIITTRFLVMLTPYALDDRFNMRMIHSIRDAEKHISRQVFSAQDGSAGTYVSFIYGGSFVFAEGDALLPKAFVLYIVLALVGIGVVCTLMLVNPVASLLMMLAVGLVVLYLFGELWVFGTRFNQVSVINMIMAVGLSVDYAVYFAQRFMTCTADGSGNGRMQVALADTGSAVFLGGFTALLGTVPMAFSKSVIIRTFFKLIFGTIIFALLVGLMLMPVLFSLIPLPAVKSALVDKDSSSGAGADKEPSCSGTASDAAGNDTNNTTVRSDVELGVQRL